MKNNYIDGEVIEISEQGSWKEAKLKDKNTIQDVILIEKNITIKSKDGKMYSIYCNKNINIRIGDFVYLRLNKNSIEEMYKNENTYKIAINRDKKQENKEKSHFNFMLFFFPIMLTPVLQPVLKALIENFMYMYIDDSKNLGGLSNSFTSIFGPDSFFLNVILYIVTFNTLFTITKIISDSSNNSLEEKKSNKIEHKENKESIKIKELNENISYKISLTKKYD